MPLMRNDPGSPVGADERLGFHFSVARDPILLIEGQAPLAEARVLECNHLAVELLGHPRDELVGQHLQVLHPATQPAADIAADPAQSEVQLLRQDGQVLTVERSIEAIESNGTALRVLALHDVTASRLLERALLRIQQMDNLGAVSGAVVHDFRNLLIGVRANAELALQSPALDEDARQHLGDICLSADRATELADRILPRSADLDRGFESTDLNALVTEAVDLVRLSIQDGVTLGLELATGIPHISADPTQLRQVVMNLVINAAEAISDGGRIRIRTGTVDAQDVDLTDAQPPIRSGARHLVYLEVNDNGRGFDAATRRRVFEPLFTTKATGTGLGLTAVMFAARRHQGTLIVRSRRGRGSTFRIYLPADQA